MNKLKSLLNIVIYIVNFIFISYLALALVSKISHSSETWWILLSPILGMAWVWLWFKFKYKQSVVWSKLGFNIITLIAIYYCVSSYKPVIMYLLNYNVIYRATLSDSIKNDTEVLLKYANKNEYYWAMEISGDIARDSEIFIEKLVSHDGRFLKYASSRLQDNKNIVKIAINAPEHFGYGLDGYAIEYASKRLKNDLVIITEGIAKNGIEVVLYSGDEIRNDPEKIENIITAYLEENKDIKGDKVVSLCETIKKLEYAGEKYGNLIKDCKSILLLKQFKEIQKMQKETKRLTEKIKNINCYPKYKQVGPIQMQVGTECF
jgi:hypothetical protein